MNRKEARLLLDQHKRHPLEADLTKLVKDWLELQSDLFHIKLSDGYQKGYSDILICVRGWYVACELKADDGTPSPHQLKFIDKVRRAGGIGEVCYTLYEVIQLVEQARSRGWAVDICRKI
jgi:hypothetical protein